MSRWARVVAVCALTLASAGCLRYDAQLQVDAAGTVSGQLVVAFRAELSTNLAQRFEVPPLIRDKVAVAPYEADGYVGSTVSFDRLSMDEVGALFGGGQRTGATVRLSMTRTGDEVSVTGSAFFPDLSMLGGSNDGFDARIALSFTGASTVNANGTVAGQDVTWSPQPGTLLPLSAHAVYPAATETATVTGPASSGVSPALFIGVCAVLAGVVVLLLAQLLRRRPAVAAYPPASPAVRPARPAARTAALPAPPGALPTPPGVPPAWPAIPPAWPAIPPAWPAVPPGPYADPYPTVPSGPGLSPENTLRLPTVPLPDDPGPSYRHDQPGW